MSDTLAPTLTRVVEGREVPTEGTYAIDASHTSVGFVARHLVVAKVRGNFAGVSGIVTIADDPAQSSVQVEIDAATVSTGDAGRDEHLRSADFFDVENHPTWTYRSTSVRPDGKRWLVDGELTIRQVTQPVTLTVEFEGGAQDPWGGSRAVFSASGEVDREAFGLTWNQALETGGVLVGKVVKIEIEAEAVRSA